MELDTMGIGTLMKHNATRILACLATMLAND
jgi:hypothetical protein